MILDELMNKVGGFVVAKFPQNRPYTAALHKLKEETAEAIESGELVEFADCLNCLLDAYRIKFNGQSTELLIAAASDKIDVCYTREWGEPDENGSIHHIKNSQ